MKKILLGATLALTIIATSCSNDSTVDMQEQNIEMSARISLKSAIDEYKNTSSNGINKAATITFDVDNIKETYPKDKEGRQIFTAYEYGYSLDNPVKTALNFIMKDGVVVNKVIAQTDQSVQNVNIARFYNADWTEIGGVVIDPDKEVITPIETTDDCGDEVIECLTDAYSNHGWLSVALFIETAFIPETAVVMATVCWDELC